MLRDKWRSAMLRSMRAQLAAVLAVAALLGYPAPTPAAPLADKPPRNIIFVICDQETHHLTARGDYKLPARQALMRHGVTFGNHYIASAMCSASRAASAGDWATAAHSKGFSLLDAAR